MGEKFPTELVEALYHPCRKTCYGWRNGYENGELDIYCKLIKEHTAAMEKLQAKNDMLVKALKEIREGNALMAEGEGDDSYIYQEMAMHWMKHADQALAENEG